MRERHSVSLHSAQHDRFYLKLQLGINPQEQEIFQAEIDLSRILPTWTPVNKLTEPKAQVRMELTG